MMASRSLEALFYNTYSPIRLLKIGFTQHQKYTIMSFYLLPCISTYLVHPTPHVTVCNPSSKPEPNLIPSYPTTFQETDKRPFEGCKDLLLTLSSSTRSSRFFPRGLMGLTISAIMMSMPLDSCLAMQVCKKMRREKAHVNLRTHDKVHRKEAEG